MCIGAPMVVVECDDMSALCRRGEEIRRVGMALVGAQPPGAHVLVHLDNAVRVLEQDEALLIDRALDGLAAAMRGESFEDRFADLIGRTPELPPHLR
jgi:hydrogenase expression/formation protein HypC